MGINVHKDAENISN